MDREWLILQFLLYGLMAMSSLLSQFFAVEGLTKTQIGILMAIPPLSSLYANPINFAIATRLGRVSWLKRVVILCGVFFFALYFFKSFLLRLLGMVSFAFFFSAITPLSESVMVDAAHRARKDYGKVRFLGTLGFSVTAVFMSFLVRIHFLFVFVTFLVYTTLLYLVLRNVDEVEVEKDGEESKGNTVPRFFWLILPVVTFGIVANSFNFIFLPVLMEERKYDVSLASVALSLMAITEVFFLFNSEKLIKKLGISFLLSSSIFVIGLRNLLVSFTERPSTLLMVQLLQGWTYIVIYYSVITLTRDFGRARIKAQKYFWMAMGVGPFFGSLLGGFLSERIGLLNTYRLFGVVPMVVSFFNYHLLVRLEGGR